jgi:YegS/Rv2252/BmrU family lipid kinase
VRPALVVVNPAAGGGRTARLWPRLREELRGLGLAFDCVTTARPGHAIDLARAAVEAGVELVLAVGGDGTLNEVVNGVTDGAGPRACVGAVLTGRGRDAARNLGLAADPRRAVRRVVEGADVALDLVLAEWPDGTRRWVVGAAGAGFDAAVAARAARSRAPGTLPYLLAVLATLHAHAPAGAEVEADGEVVVSGRITAAVVANGAYYGGGMRIAPGAHPADGRLDLVVLGDLRRRELALWLPTVYRGRHLAHPKVFARAARCVTVRAPRPLPVHVDGETAPPTPVTFTIRPGALRLRV